MYRHRHLGSSTCWTRRHSMHTKTRKKSSDFPWWPVSPSPTTVGVVAPGPDLSRSRRTLSGTPRSDAQVHHTTGAAASPVRASLDRPLATPRAQDQDEDQNDRNSKTKTRTKTTGRQRRGPRRKKDSDEGQDDKDKDEGQDEKRLRTSGTQELTRRKELQEEKDKTRPDKTTEGPSVPLL